MIKYLNFSVFLLYWYCNYKIIKDNILFMKKIDSIDVCTFILHILLVLTIAIGILAIMAMVCSHKQTECFVDQNDYCVVINKDSHLVPQVMGKFVTTRQVSRIDVIGITTQDTLTIDINSRLFNDIEIGDTIKTIKLSCHE